jgi:predicted nucleotidyltransferase
MRTIRAFLSMVDLSHASANRKQSRSYSWNMPHSRRAKPAGFGSILRHDSDPAHSDVDVLVEFDLPGANSFSNFLKLKEALEALLQRPIDLVEPRAIRNRRLRYYIDQRWSREAAR